MGERLLCKQEVIGSIPFTSTISRRLMVCKGSRDSGARFAPRKRAVQNWCGGPVPCPAACGLRGIPRMPLAPPRASKS